MVIPGREQKFERVEIGGIFATSTPTVIKHRESLHKVSSRRWSSGWERLNLNAMGYGCKLS